MNQFLTVIKFHFLEGIKSKGYLVIMSIICLAIIAGYGIVNYNSKKDAKSKDKYVVVNTTQFTIDEKTIESTLDDVSIIKKSSMSYNEIKKSLLDNKSKGVIVISEANNIPQVENYSISRPNQSLTALISQQLQSKYVYNIIEKQNIDPNVAKQLFAQVTVKDTQVKKEETKDTEKTFGIVYIFVFLMYMFLISFGQGLAQSITAEKSSRVMELMLAKVKPLTMMYGKIISTFLMAIVQILAIGCSFSIVYLLGWVSKEKMPLMGMNLDVSELSITIIIMFLIYFFLGYLLYAMLYAAVGAMASRIEDLSSVSLPVVALILGAFFIGMTSLHDPSATIVKVGSYIPFFTPIVTFSRIVSGAANTFEIATTISLLVVTILILNTFASRVYLNGVMNYTEKFSWKNFKMLIRKD
ncbi:MAG: hypothetical protein K0S51_888 [Bacillales bacterium]|jgi:ABC-2 type transport system permease protein|nr:hypothetical protein [Bacillales bacterium]